MGQKSKVFCSGCAHLLLLKDLRPLCVATAKFVPGPLRSEIDVAGYVEATLRNKNNDCQYRQSVSLNAYRLKRRMVAKALENGYGPIRLKDIPYDEEQRLVTESEGYEEGDEYEEFEIFEEDEEDRESE